MSAHALRSSSCLARTNSRMSGCQLLSVCMIAARRVLPPLLIVPPVASCTFMKETGPDGVPPPESFSRLERSFDQSAPTPEPNLNSRALSPISCQMSSMESSTEMMKQALAWGRTYGSTSMTVPVSASQPEIVLPPVSVIPYWWWRPTLNQAGLLKAPYWLTQSQVSSSENRSATASVAK